MKNRIIFNWNKFFAVFATVAILNLIWLTIATPLFNWLGFVVVVIFFEIVPGFCYGVVAGLERRRKRR